MAPGETIEQGDEFLVREGNAGRWIEARNRIGTKVAFKEDFRRPQHTPPKSALHMQAQHAERAEWPEVIGSGGAAPGEKPPGLTDGKDFPPSLKKSLFACMDALAEGEDQTTDQIPPTVSEKLHAPEPPAASVQDAHAGGADAPEKAGMSHKPADAWDGVKS